MKFFFWKKTFALLTSGEKFGIIVIGEPNKPCLSFLSLKRAWQQGRALRLEEVIGELK